MLGYYISVGCYLYPKRFFSFDFFLTTSILRSFQVLFLSLIGRLPIYLPEKEKIIYINENNNILYIIMDKNNNISNEEVSRHLENLMSEGMVQW